MDFYRFINSRDIREYHRQINYQYNAGKAGWLVWQCRDADLKEKHEAWQWIIDNMEDYEVGDLMNYDCDSSIHAMMKKYMAMQDELVSRFFRKGEDAIYQLTYKEKDSMCYQLFDCDRIISNIEEFFEKEMVINYFGKDVYENVDRLRIRKNYIDTNKYIEVFCDAKDIHKVYKVEAWPSQHNKNGKELYEELDALQNYSFFGLWFDFPLPFKKGDIVWNPFTKVGPMVYEGNTTEGKYDNWSHDSSDMNVHGYFVNINGDIYHNVSDEMMDYERAEDTELEGYDKMLIPVSEFLKGQLSLEPFLKVLDYLKLKQKTQDSVPNGWYDIGVTTEDDDECVSQDDTLRDVIEQIEYNYRVRDLGKEIRPRHIIDEEDE